MRRQTISTTCAGLDEILQRVTDGYRKLRNTARFALGNFYGFDPARDSVPFEEMEEIDRWALAELDRVTKTLAAYEAFEFHTVYQALFNFATVTLSARYFDIIKDRLYTFAPRNKARRSAQTALLRIVRCASAHAGADTGVYRGRDLGESSEPNGEPSIHLALFPNRVRKITTLLSEWERLFAIRDQVLRALEEAREQSDRKLARSKSEIGSVRKHSELLQRHQNDLRYLFIVSQVELGHGRKAEDGFD